MRKRTFPGVVSFYLSVQLACLAVGFFVSTLLLWRRLVSFQAVIGPSDWHVLAFTNAYAACLELFLETSTGLTFCVVVDHGSCTLWPFFSKRKAMSCSFQVAEVRRAWWSDNIAKMESRWRGSRGSRGDGWTVEHGQIFGLIALPFSGCGVKMSDFFVIYLIGDIYIYIYR